MHWLIAAAVGALVSVVGALLVARATGRPVSARQLLAAGVGGAVSGLVLVATLGTGSALALGGGTLGRGLAAFATSGAAAGAAEQTTSNVLAGAPLSQGVAVATLVGAGEGAVLGGVGRGLVAVARPIVTRVAARAIPTPVSITETLPPPAPPAEIGVVQILEGERPTPRDLNPQAAPRAPPTGDDTAAKSETTAPKSAWVHGAPPAWLEARFQATVDAVRDGKAGPKATPEDVNAFLHETYEHVAEVNALVTELGGHARPIPSVEPATGEAMRGVHDFGERASVRRVQELVDQLRNNPITLKDGTQLEVPDWLVALPQEARLAGEKTIDVGKLSPHVAAGLAKNGPPDPFAIKLHNLSAHHSSTPGGSALIEAVADRVNAMRQPRIYRQEPMSFDKIREIISGAIDRGELPTEARPILEQALAAEERLEHSGAVNPYYLNENGR